MGDGRDGGVVFLQRIDGPAHGPAGQDRPLPGQRMFFAEDLPGAVFVGATPHPFGPDQPGRSAETRDIMQTNLPPAVAHCDDTTIGATIDGLIGFDVDDQASGGLGDGGDVHAGDTPKGVGTFTPRPAGAGSRVGQVGVSFEIGSLVATKFKEALTHLSRRHAGIAPTRKLSRS